MKRSKDADKVTEPMFPRLSVNDADKGGPRAPPRNKMALYEQLCTPAQRFNGGRFSSNPGMKPSNSMPHVSSKQVSGFGKSLFPPLHVPPSIPTTQSERHDNYSNRGMNLNSFPQVEVEQRQNVGDEDDYTVPVYLRSDTYVRAPNRGNSGAAKSGIGPSYFGHPSRNMSSAHVTLEHNGPPMPNRDDRGNHGQVHRKERLSTKYDSVKYDMGMKSREMINRHAKPASGSSPQGFHHLLSKDSDRQHGSNACMQQKFGTTLLDEDVRNGGNIEDFSRGMSHGHVSRQMNICNSGVDQNDMRQPLVDKESQGHQSIDPTPIENAEKCDEMSETSMVDSMSGLDITPDDVVGIIGYKHFLKARKAITNQQRVFSVQVFELHRLIQVQRLIAGSPQLMVDDNAFIGKALKDPSATKAPQLEYAVKPPVHRVKPKSQSDKPNRVAECTAENAVKTDSRNGTQMPNYGPYSGNVPPALSSGDPRSAPWCYPQPSGHQWLVPVMSPSEGLIYKPYPGPGFMSQASEGFGPMGGPPDSAAHYAHGGFMNPPYGGFPSPYFPPYTPHPQGVGMPPGQSYFPPFSMPSANPALSSSAVEQMPHQVTGPGPGVYQQPLQSTTGASNPNQLQNQSSCNLQNQSSEAASQARKVCQPKESGIQVSTASSPLQRPHPRRRGTTVRDGTPSIETRNPLSLFPKNPATTDGPSSPPPPSHPASYLPRVIKVVPHNARSATESAARIFQSIQRERKHQDNPQR